MTPIGLLRPTTVDEVRGYRFSATSQLSQLNRIVALKELGFTLHQVNQFAAGAG